MTFHSARVVPVADVKPCSKVTGFEFRPKAIPKAPGIRPDRTGTPREQ
jgi:hypothetical protein